jgi:hypothetical protein
MLTNVEALTPGEPRAGPSLTGDMDLYNHRRMAAGTRPGGPGRRTPGEPSETRPPPAPRSTRNGGPRRNPYEAPQWGRATPGPTRPADGRQDGRRIDEHQARETPRNGPQRRKHSNILFIGMRRNPRKTRRKAGQIRTA